MPVQTRPCSPRRPLISHPPLRQRTRPHLRICPASQSSKLLSNHPTCASHSKQSTWVQVRQNEKRSLTKASTTSSIVIFGTERGSIWGNFRRVHKALHCMIQSADWFRAMPEQPARFVRRQMGQARHDWEGRGNLDVPRPAPWAPGDGWGGLHRSPASSVREGKRRRGACSGSFRYRLAVPILDASTGIFGLSGAANAFNRDRGSRLRLTLCGAADTTRKVRSRGERASAPDAIRGGGLGRSLA